MRRPNFPSRLCSHPDCAREATIIHRTRAYCGEHALAKLESGARPDQLSAGMK